VIQRIVFTQLQLNATKDQEGYVIEVVVAGAGPNGLMLACELGLAGIRPMVLDPMPGPNPNPRVNRIVGQGVRILDHRGLYSAPTGTAEPPKPAPRSMFAGFALGLASVAVNLAWKLAAVSSGRVELVLVATYYCSRRSRSLMLACLRW
jgi:cation diffusion facilitator CzcD-associated flavoprotein CzcO